MKGLCNRAHSDLVYFILNCFLSDVRFLKFVRFVSSLLSAVVILFVLVLSLYFCCLIILTTKFLNIVVQEIFALLYRYRKTYGSLMLR